MSSSREVTGQKKRDVWEDVAAEFYQESYPSGSKPPGKMQRRPSRLALPLPSHTARRGSLLQGGRSYKNGTRKRKSALTITNTQGRGLTYTSTMAADANGTTTNANDIQVEILPDLSEDTILNEKKTWEELQRIKSMPVPMAQKKLLKAQLATLPKLRLKGWANCKWTVKKWWNGVLEDIIHTYRHTIFLNNSLRTIELRSGTAIVNVFLFIKWTLFLNLAISVLLIAFVIGPFIIHDIVHGRAHVLPDTNCTGFERRNLDLDNLTVLNMFTTCCYKKYEQEVAFAGNRGAVQFIVTKLGLGNFDDWPLTFSYYNETVIRLVNSVPYRFDIAYLLTGCAIMFLCLIIMVHSMANGVRDIIHMKEGDFYKYSNLLFSGWDHYTNDEKGAEFKRRLIRHEMKVALQTEKRKITDLLTTKKQKAKIYVVRGFINMIVLLLLVGAAFVVFYITDFITNQQLQNFNSNTNDPAAIWFTVIGFAPSIIISVLNLVSPLILARLGRLEKYHKGAETGILLLRALFFRLIAIFAAAYRIYLNVYCDPVPGHCTKCLDQNRASSEVPCYESVFADQLYRLILTDLSIKCLMTFVTDPIRRLIGYCFSKNRILKRIGQLNFDIVRHSLDIIYIQTLSWLSFYFAPFAPIFAVVYCFCVFYIKKFSVLYNCKSVPDTYRTIRSTGIFMIAKITSFVLVLFTFAYLVRFMKPSAACGPFRGRESAWESLSEHVNDNYEWLQTSFERFGTTVVCVPLGLVIIMTTYYYYSVAQANRAMVETLRHLLILEGHDKQYLFAKLNSLRRSRRDLARGELRQRSLKEKSEVVDETLKS